MVRAHRPGLPDIVGDEQTVGLLRSTPDPPTKLVQLGQAEALGLLDDHDGGVRDIDADLDDRCGH